MSQSPSQQSKRKRAPVVDAANIIEGESRRAKRRKDGSPVKVSESVSSAAGDASVDVEGEGEEEVKQEVRAEEGVENVSMESRKVATDLGIKLLEALRKATNSSGLHLSNDFIRLPNRRQYPDYYVQIKQPIAFDDIRAKLDAHGYASFDDVKADFDLCFKNAKRYNMKNSDIWSAARDLQRVAGTTWKALRPPMPEMDEKHLDGPEDEDGDDVGGSPSKDGEKRKAGRPPSLYKKYQSRLDKIVEKQDSEGNYHSDVFMDLVPKKDYPDYYQIIKKPTSFNMIYKRIKRKEYASPKAFMDDVELVFANAVTYNEDHSQVWEDAKILQAAFNALCADWRAEFSDTNANASGSAVPKLKLKVPPTKADPVTVRLPHMGGASSASGTPSQPQQPQLAPVDTPTHPAARPQLQPASATPSSILAQPSPAYARPTPPVIPIHLQASTPVHASRSPSVVPHPPTITGLVLVTYPSGRRIPISQGGLTRLSAWSLRLGWEETRIVLTVDLKSEPGSTPAPSQNGNGTNPSTNGGGETPDPVEIKCNAVALLSKPSVDDPKKPRWDVPLVLGTNMLEVRVRGSGRPGNVWRISVDRTM
ncbi:Bromodomain-containing protein [Ceratobasidium sp. AG-I]|nr:Bromodomain-containing protein [Ceratobasidium sp. AG-I]